MFSDDVVAEVATYLPIAERAKLRGVCKSWTAPRICFKGICEINFNRATPLQLHSHGAASAHNAACEALLPLLGSTLKRVVFVCPPSNVLRILRLAINYCRANLAIRLVIDSRWRSMDIFRKLVLPATWSVHIECYDPYMRLLTLPIFSMIPL